MLIRICSDLQYLIPSGHPLTHVHIAIDSAGSIYVRVTIKLMKKRPWICEVKGKLRRGEKIRWELCKYSTHL